jgi:dTDP-4-dehydrorhamnose reductase
MEDDFPDANDLYGRTKYLGEVKGENAVTLRTSIIGHELQGKLSLVEWFMAQKGSVNGYVNAIYSGFPTIELARIVDEYVIPNPELKGLYHVSSEPISKYELLTVIAEVYGKNIEIIPYEVLGENKSLVSLRFRKVTGYCPPPWKDLVRNMYENYKMMSTFYG